MLWEGYLEQECFQMVSKGRRWCYGDETVRQFQIFAAATGKARLPTVESPKGGTTRRLVPEERSERRPDISVTRLSCPRYRGATPQRTLWVSTAILNSTRSGTRSQCRHISASLMWSERRRWKISRAAALRTDCNLRMQHAVRIDGWIRRNYWLTNGNRNLICYE